LICKRDASSSIICLSYSAKNVLNTSPLWVYSSAERKEEKKKEEKRREESEEASLTVVSRQSVVAAVAAVAACTVDVAVLPPVQSLRRAAIRFPALGKQVDTTFLVPYS